MADQSDAPVLKTEVRDTAPPSPDALSGFYDAFTANRAYERSDWNVERYVARMVSIIDDPKTDPRLAVAAMEILRKHALESLTLSGRLRGETPELPSGNVEAEVLDPEALALLKTSTARTADMLLGSETTQPPEETTDAETQEDRDTQVNDTQDSTKGGGSEDGGAYDTDQVVGHRPPTAARSGLCDLDEPGG